MTMYQRMRRFLGSLPAGELALGDDLGVALVVRLSEQAIGALYGEHLVAVYRRDGALTLDVQPRDHHALRRLLPESVTVHPDGQYITYDGLTVRLYRGLALAIRSELTSEDETIVCRSAADDYVVACHEAGHAVACLTLGLPFRHASLRPLYESVTGYVLTASVPRGIVSRLSTGVLTLRDRYRVERTIVATMAGHPAECRTRNLPCDIDLVGAYSDFLWAMETSKLLLGHAQGEPLAYLAYLTTWANGIVEGLWPVIDDVARELMQRRTVSAKRIRTLVDKLTVTKGAT